MNPAELDSAISRVSAMAPGGLLIDRFWMLEHEVRSIAEPSASVLEEDALARYVRALELAGQRDVCIVTCDADIEDPYGYITRARFEDLREALDDFFGLAFCLFPLVKDAPTILVTTANYRLVVASPATLTAVFSPLIGVRRRFDQWATDPSPTMQRLLEDAAQQMDWIETIE